LRRLQHPRLAEQRSLFRLQQQRDENGRLPAKALGDALQKLRQLEKGARQSTVAGLSVGPETDLKGLLSFAEDPTGRGWTSLGPRNFGGRTRSILLHPTNSQSFWVGSVGGGI